MSIPAVARTFTSRLIARIHQYLVFPPKVGGHRDGIIAPNRDTNAAFGVDRCDVPQGGAIDAGQVPDEKTAGWGLGGGMVGRGGSQASLPAKPLRGFALVLYYMIQKPTMCVFAQGG